ncbi:MAG: hypothetical protein JXD23_09385 [Spirochaetales bacterium]|nr:hypothetical protein [Spirochaetales bacterium]
MMVKRVLPPILALLLVGLLFLLSAFLFSEGVRSLASGSRFLAAPLLADGAELSRHEGDIVWLTGSLALAEGAQPPVGPLSETRCLYYRVEKWKGDWEEDSDGDIRRVWYLNDSDAKTGPLVLRLGTARLSIPSVGTAYENLELRKEFERRIDGDVYQFREYAIPLENEAWILGRLESGKIGPADRDVTVSLWNVRPVAWRYFGDPALFGFCAVLCAQAGLGIGGALAAWFIGKRRAFASPKAFLFFFLAAFYFWIISGGVFASLGENSPVTGIVVGLVASFLAAGPLLGEAGGERPLPAVPVFMLGIGLAVAGGWLMFDSFFPLATGLPRLLLGIIAVAAAPAILLGFRALAAKKNRVPRGNAA